MKIFFCFKERKPKKDCFCDLYSTHKPKMFFWLKGAVYLTFIFKECHKHF
ncbi:hypothetical protein NBO_397g0001 [Nosema bombycis CQ1]|uniref:Uncharacterized protein n=1 Tax=Nosema bombycis (strain CQ1 / CVCC 102059) TaxID=578461 RepID=R0KPH9_NOSB1|nr:hypothetical protein NBO_397g0001 [Nosema bombycis CQ1]|eukprot:EOB12611.1 hypothetical protein NBO_397g0001 [Nosema bombycis CQ1]